jgi:hypothetical protein
MQKEAQEQLRVRLKLVILEFADQLGVTKACQEFNAPRASFYRWKQKSEKAGCSGLYRAGSIAYRHPRKTSPEVVENILVLPSQENCPCLEKGDRTAGSGMGGGKL